MAYDFDLNIENDITKNGENFSKLVSKKSDTEFEIILMKTPEEVLENFRKWMKKNYSIQDVYNYEGTMTEEIAIKYADFVSQSSWIPVSESPEITGNYLCFHPDWGQKSVNLTTKGFDPIGLNGDLPTHWRPRLPDPPKE